MAKGGRYCDVYNTYFRHQSPNYVPARASSAPPPTTDLVPRRGRR